MRWLVGILLLANLVIFLWGYSRAPAPQITRASAPNVPTLQLQRESSPSGEAVQLAAVTGPKAGAQTQAAAPPPAAPWPSGPGLEVPPSAPVVATPPPLAAPAEEPVVAPGEPAAETPPAPAVAQAVVETAPVLAPAGPGRATVSESQAQPESLPAVPQCGRLGPFATEAAAQEAMNGLNRLEVESRLVEEVRQQPSGYWVLIPPLADRAQGKARSAELKAKGIKDIWLLAKGPLRNAISLGQFSSEANATRRAAAVKAAGFDAEIRQKTRRATRYWLTFKAPADVALPAALRPLPAGVGVENGACH